MTTENTPVTPLFETKEMYEQRKVNDVRIAPKVNGQGGTTIGGQLFQVRNGAVSATVKDYNDGIVVVNGMEVRRDHYERMVRDGAIPPGAKVYDPNPRLSQEVTPRPFGDASNGEVNAAAGDDTQADDENADEAKPDDDKPDYGDDEVGKALHEGQTALDEARASIGADNVEMALQKAAQTGDLTPPEGVTPEQAYKVMNAYVSSANEQMADLGIDSEALATALPLEDQISARMAVVEGNTAKLRHYAAKGVDALASLPVKNPDAFKDFIDQRFPDLDYEVRQGRTVVKVEGRGYVPWDTIVRMGLLTKAKVVRDGE